MTPPLEQELELCKFLKVCNPDDDDLENYCVLNSENCMKYRETVYKLREKKLDGECGE